MAFVQLVDKDRDEVLEFLSESPEYNVVLLYNVDRFGMDEGDLPLNGYYFGRRGTAGITAVGGVYNLGSLFFYADDGQAVRGMAAHLASVGRLPQFTLGPRQQVESFLSEFRGLGKPEPAALFSEWQVLRGRVTPGIDTTGTRPASLGDLDILTDMGQAMHREIFDAEGMDKDSLGELLSLQIEAGGAFVREVDGNVVSKADATMVKPHAALVGGVYTLPENRGKGHSTACVAALCENLLAEVGAVTLSVERDNRAACHSYRSMGFTKTADWMVVAFTET
jgi:hypothetical protein